MVDSNTETIKNSVRWLDNGYRHQLFAGMFLMMCWAVRFVSCTQLKYLTDEDALIAQCLMFNALVVWMVVRCSKLMTAKRGKGASKFVLFATVGFALLSSMSIAVKTMETFKRFMNVLSCERYSFSNLELTGDGMIVGRLVDCPWPIINRKDVGSSYLCPFDNRSIELVIRQHWKRDLGLINYQMSIFAIAISVAVVLVPCVPMIQLIFTFGFRNNKNNNNPLASVNYADVHIDNIGSPPPPSPPPPYSPREPASSANQ